MEVTQVIQCTYCGQMFELTIDTSADVQNWVTDCEICCRPLKIVAECEPGEVLSLSVEPA